MSAMGAVRLPWRTIAPRLARPPLRPPALRLHRPMHTGPTRPFPSRLLLALVPLGLGSATLLADRDTERPAALVPSTDFLPTPGLALDERPGTLYRVLDLLREYLVEPLCTTGRFIHLAILFLPVLLTAPILLLELVEGGSSRRRRVKRVTERGSTRWWYGFLVAQMARAGPTFIKLAQWAGSRTDLFPAQLCVLFGRLHSNGKPHSIRYTQRIIERAFGRPFAEIFIEFGQDPIGVGAIAQVYKAVLNPDLLPEDYLGPKHTEDPSPVSRIGRTIAPRVDHQIPTKVPSAAVAIKVLHPGVEKMIRRDLKIMAVLAAALNVLPGMEWLSFPQEVEVFGGMMLSQVDLRIEADNLSTFEDNFRHRPTVSFPRPLRNYTSSQVLIEEYEDAVPLEAFLKQSGGAFDHRIAKLGLDAFLNMLLIDQLTHADLHPGNIMIKFFKPTTKNILASLWASWVDGPERDLASDPANVDGVAIVHRLRKLAKGSREEWLSELDRLDDEGYQPEIVFIDAGLVTKLDGKNRADFLDLFSAVAQFDGYRAGRLMVERCRAPELVINEETFALRMQHLVLSVKSQTFSLSKIKIADILGDVLYNVREHHVKLEGDFINTVLSILLLEGIGRQLDPDMDLFTSGIHVMRQLGTRVRPSDILSSGVDVKGLGALFGIWVWVEAKEMVHLAIGEVDDMLRWDFLTSNI